MIWDTRFTWTVFWRPITSQDAYFQWWRKVHIWAHIIGGAVWYALVANPWLFQSWIHDSAPVRLLFVVLVQSGWERIQHENWRPELMTPPWPPESTYPWWSAVWDVIFALPIPLLIEGVRWLI